ncbi:MAG: HdeD family acid-resistance protein [Acutalibacteraceae bacterium]
MNTAEKTSVKRAKAAYITYSAVLLALGITMLFIGESQIVLLAKITGGVLLCCGIVKFIAYFTNDAYGLAFQFDFALGIFTVIMGLLLLIYPKSVLQIANILIGIFVIVDGAFKLQTAKDAKTFGMKYWWMILIFALITTLAGLFVVFNPLKATLAITAVCGIALIADGIENLYTAIYTVRLIKRINNLD